MLCAEASVSAETSCNMQHASCVMMLQKFSKSTSEIRSIYPPFVNGLPHRTQLITAAEFSIS